MTDQIIAKIKKLLELAASPVPSESSLAFAKATALMAKYSISEADLNLNEGTKSPEIIKREYSLKTKAPIGLMEQLPFIAQSIGKPFGVFVLVKSIEKRILLVGFPTNTELVDYAIDCVLNQCIADYRVMFAEMRSISFAPSFWQGVSEALDRRFAPASQNSNEAGLTVYDPVKKFMEQFTGTAYWGSSTSDLASARSAGNESGRNAQIRKAVGFANSGKLLS